MLSNYYGYFMKKYERFKHPDFTGETERLYQCRMFMNGVTGKGLAVKALYEAGEA